MLVKHWHKDGKKTKRERLAPAKLRAVRTATKNLSSKLKKNSK